MDDAVWLFVLWRWSFWQISCDLQAETGRQERVSTISDGPLLEKPPSSLLCEKHKVIVCLAEESSKQLSKVLTSMSVYGAEDVFMGQMGLVRWIEGLITHWGWISPICRGWGGGLWKNDALVYRAALHTSHFASWNVFEIRFKQVFEEKSEWVEPTHQAEHSKLLVVPV